MSIYWSAICLSIYPSTYLSYLILSYLILSCLTCLTLSYLILYHLVYSIYLSIYPSIYLSIDLSIYLFLYLPHFLSIHLPIYRSISIYLLVCLPKSIYVFVVVYSIQKPIYRTIVLQGNPYLENLYIHHSSDIFTAEDS